MAVWDGGAEGRLTMKDAEIIVAKQPNGPTGIVKLHWNAAMVRFENIGQGA